MGWWNDNSKGSKVILGDEPLDLLHEAVAGFSRAYLEDTGRKPTLEEFRRTLALVLGGDPGAYFADLESDIVGEVVLCRKKVPKRQSFSVGDYFAIPVDGQFWYGRIIHRGAADHLVEVYDLQHDRLLTLRQVLGRKRKVVFNKHVFSIPAFTRRRWRIIGHEDIPKNFRYPAFYGGLVAHGYYILWRGDDEYRVPKAQAMKHEPKQVWRPERIEDALRAMEFGVWPEVAESKKDTFDNHDKKLRFLHEYFQIPMRKKRGRGK